jgi:hypothetical protein
MKDLIKPSQKNGSLLMSRISLRKTLATSSTYAVPHMFVLIAISCSWRLMVLLVNPSGEFPLNDDWAYARAVQTLIQNGRLELTDFTSMPLIAQVFWGA